MSAKSNYVCDGCGVDAESEGRRWLSKMVDGWGMVDVEQQGADDADDLTLDLCPNCYPDVKAAVEQVLRRLRTGRAPA